MTDLIIPVGVRIARFAELTPDAQQTLLRLIDDVYVTRGPKDVSRDIFRDGMIELLECGEACIEQGPHGIELKLVKKEGDLLL